MATQIKANNVQVAISPEKKKTERLLLAHPLPCYFPMFQLRLTTRVDLFCTQFASKLTPRVPRVQDLVTGKGHGVCCLFYSSQGASGSQLLLLCKQSANGPSANNCDGHD